VDNLRHIRKWGILFKESMWTWWKVLPALPMLGKDTSGDRRQLIWPSRGAISGVIEECAKMDISGAKILTARSASQFFFSPTSTLESLEQDSPPSPTLVTNPCG
jgi:hypothetical protein